MFWRHGLLGEVVALTLRRTLPTFFFLRSSCVLLLDQVTFDILLKVDNVASLDTSSDTGVSKQDMNGRVSFLKSCGLTSLGGDLAL